MSTLDRAAVIEKFSVSRETIARVDAYVGALEKWTPRINLVAKSTLPDLWTRHVADSLQVAELLQEQDLRYCDFGSGGGLPGLIVAAVLAEKQPQTEIILVESDQRKAAFLMSAAREMGVTARVMASRIESLPKIGANVISARALAPLPKLLEWASPHLAPGGRCLFLKGAAFRQEIDEALVNWRFDSEKWTSATNPDAVVLELRNIAHV